MGLYTELHPEVASAILARADGAGQIHGSEAHEIVCCAAYGRRSVDSYDTERILTELVDEGQLVVLERAPTPSQRAFAGITYSRRGYRELGWAPGTKTHHWFSRKRTEAA
jgi:hypothetical protein